MRDGVAHRRLTSRRAFLGAGVTVALAGCTAVFDDDSSDGANDDGGAAGDADGGGSNGSPDEKDGNGVDSPQVEGTPLANVLEEPRVPLSASLSEYADAAADSAASKDGIPAIDDPSIADAESAEAHVADERLVFGVEIDGAARAYPHRVVVWHEIVSDTLGGTDFSVTYCPLTGTAIGYERGDENFGVEGWLINNNLIMFDRGTESWWPQVLGTCVDGDLKRYSLPEVRVVWTTWSRWKRVYPETTVLTDETGYARNYARDPYGSYAPHPESGYYVNDSLFFPVMAEDSRLHAKGVVIGARSGDGAIAFEKDSLRQTRVMSAKLEGRTYLALYHPGLDTGFVYREPADGSMDADGQSIDQVGDEYAFDGVRYAADDIPLDPVNAFDAMWFAWFAFYPDTELVR